MTSQDKLLSQALREIDAFTSNLSSLMKELLFTWILKAILVQFHPIICPSLVIFPLLFSVTAFLYTNAKSEASTSMPFLTSLNAVHVLTGFQETRDYLACSGLQKEKNRSSLEFTARSTKVWPLLSFIHILSCRFKSAWSCDGLWSSTAGWRMMSRRCWTT